MMLLNWLAHMIFPPRCVLCNRVLKEETDLCRDCRLHAPECPITKTKRNFLDSWLALWYYEGKVPGSLLLYKFRRRQSKALGYGRLLAMKIQQQYPQPDVLTWVPVSRARKLTRGYDQVELLARVVGQQLQMKPVRLLKKVRNNSPQSSVVGIAARRANVLGVYRVTDPEKVRDKKILLLDDILTTGATASEAARMLQLAGAKQIYFAAVAATRRDKNE